MTSPAKPTLTKEQIQVRIDYNNKKIEVLPSTWYEVAEAKDDNDLCNQALLAITERERRLAAEKKYGVIRDSVRIDPFGEFVLMLGDPHEREDIKAMFDSAIDSAMKEGK